MRRSALIVSMLAVFAVGAGPAEAQLWKPQPKKPAAAASKPTKAKPARAPRVRRASKPSRPAPRRQVVRDDPPPPSRDRARDRGRSDDLPEFDDSPTIVVEMPTRGER